MPSCVFKHCKNYSEKLKKEDGVSFHRFPTRDIEVNEKWIEVIRFSRNDPSWNPASHTVVCSEHFESADLYFTKKGLRRVLRSGYPKILPVIPERTFNVELTKPPNVPPPLPPASDQSDDEELSQPTTTFDAQPAAPNLSFLNSNQPSTSCATQSAAPNSSFLGSNQPFTSCAPQSATPNLISFLNSNQPSTSCAVTAQPAAPNPSFLGSNQPSASCTYQLAAPNQSHNLNINQWSNKYALSTVPVEIEHDSSDYDNLKEYKLRKRVISLETKLKAHRRKIKTLNQKVRRLGRRKAARGHRGSSTSAAADGGSDDADLNSGDDLSDESSLPCGRPARAQGKQPAKHHTNVTKLLHEGIQCSECRGPIAGFRYTCVQCADYELCAACEANDAHAQHYVLRVPAPRPYYEIQAVMQRIRRELMSGMHAAVPAGAGDDEHADSFKVEVKMERGDPGPDPLRSVSGTQSSGGAQWGPPSILEQTLASIKVEEINVEYEQESDAESDAEYDQDSDTGAQYIEMLTHTTQRDVNKPPASSQAPHSYVSTTLPPKAQLIEVDLSTMSVIGSQKRPNIPQERPNVTEGIPNVPHEKPTVTQERSNVKQERLDLPQERPNVKQERPTVTQERPIDSQEKSNFKQERVNVPQKRPNVPQRGPAPKKRAVTDDEEEEEESFGFQVLTHSSAEKAVSSSDATTDLGTSKSKAAMKGEKN